jgi:hypothetical protein
MCNAAKNTSKISTCWFFIGFLKVDFVLKQKRTLGTVEIPRVFDNPHSG